MEDLCFYEMKVCAWTQRFVLPGCVVRSSQAGPLRAQQDTSFGVECRLVWVAACPYGVQNSGAEWTTGFCAAPQVLNTTWAGVNAV